MKWLGSTVGALAGLTIAGGLAASPEYIANPVLGIGTGAIAATVGFGIDRRRVRADRAARWAASFADEPAEPANRTDSFVRRLEPQNSVVDFEHRRFRAVKPIREWCRDRAAAPVWLLAGDPGSGKTRLAMQVASAVKTFEIEPYVCGWPKGHDISVALDANRPVLIIVDDAEARHDLAEMLTVLHRDGPGRVRMLLVARAFDGWWERLQLQVPNEVRVANDWTGSVLGPLPGTASDQRAVAKRAVAAFAAERNVDPAAVEVLGVEEGTPIGLLHAAALEGVVREDTVSAGEAVAALIDREREVWRERAVRRGLPAVTDDALRDLLVLATIVGVRVGADPGPLVRTVPGLEDATDEQVVRLMVWMRMYHRTAGYDARPLLPSTIVDGLLAEAFGARPGLIGAVAEPEQKRAVLAGLARHGEYNSDAIPVLGRVLASDPPALLPIAVELARAGMVATVAAAASAVATTAIDRAVMSELRKSIDYDELALRPLAIALAKAELRLAAAGTDRVDALITLHATYHTAGLEVEARQVIQEATAEILPLAQADPAGLIRQLTYVTLFRHLDLAATGRHDEALQLADYLVDFWEGVGAGADSNGRLLLTHRVMRASTMVRAGRPEEALEAIDAIIRVFRARLPEPREPDDSDEIGGLIHALSVRLDAFVVLGRLDEAEEVASEALALYDQLSEAGESPPGAVENVSQTLGRLADAYAEEDLVEEAANASRMSVDGYRWLAGADPAVYGRTLATALSELTGHLNRTQHTDEAGVIASEAVVLWRRLAAADPRDLADLAFALAGQSEAQLRLGHRRDAEATAREAIDAGERSGNRRILGKAKMALALTYSSDHREEEAVAIAGEVLQMYLKRANDRDWSAAPEDG